MTLYIEIFQPYAQYRNPFTFYYAQSYPLPPKATIVGMLQNAADDWYGFNGWYEEKDKSDNGLKKNKWWDDLKISVHGGFESFFWNYQQLIKGYPEIAKINNNIFLWDFEKKAPLYGEGKKAQRTPVHQQELFNGRLFIFLRGDDELIDKIKKSLEKPKKVLSLGRSEDIIYIRRIEYVDGKLIRDIEGDIRLTYPTYIKRENGEKEFPIKNQKYPVYSIPVRIIFKNDGKPVKHKAEITKHTERDVKFKDVIYTGTDYSIILKDREKIDGEIYKINGKKFLIIDKFGWL